MTYTINYYSGCSLSHSGGNVIYQLTGKKSKTFNPNYDNIISSTERLNKDTIYTRFCDGHTSPDSFPTASTISIIPAQTVDGPYEQKMDICKFVTSNGISSTIINPEDPPDNR